MTITRIRTVEIITADISKMGGLLEAKKVADHADTYRIPGAPSNVANSVGTVATALVRAAMGHFLVKEFHAHDVPRWGDLAEEDPTIADGFLPLSERPGHSLALNECVAGAHPKPGASFFGDAP